MEVKPGNMPRFVPGDMVVSWSNVPSLVIAVRPNNSVPDMEHRSASMLGASGWRYYLWAGQQVTGPFASSELAGA